MWRPPKEGTTLEDLSNKESTKDTVNLSPLPSPQPEVMGKKKGLNCKGGGGGAAKNRRRVVGGVNKGSCGGKKP